MKDITAREGCLAPRVYCSKDAIEVVACPAQSAARLTFRTEQGRALRSSLSAKVTQSAS